MVSVRAKGLFVLVATVAVGLVLVVPSAANVSATSLGVDPYSNPTSQHQTAVEPDSFSYGSTIVTAFQLGRFFDGGSSNIGFSTSTNGGASWTSGQLPGTTVYSSPAGPYDRDTDPSVAYDAKDNVWLIASLPLTTSGGVKGAAAIVNRSTNGGLAWGNAVTVATAGSGDLDKTWIACDDTPASPFYGRCYVEYDDFGSGNRVHVAYSADGGQTWTQGSMPSTSVIGGQPVVQPSGTVVMPINNGNETSVIAFRSTNGGVSWGNAVTVASIKSHGEGGGLRSDPLPSAEIDGAGKVYVVWADCRFRKRCAENDLVMSTSSDGLTWSAVSRVPIDSTKSTVDHFIPGLAVDASTSGSTAHLGLAYYYYPSTNCNSSTCQLDVGYVSSSDGGSTWSAPTQLAGPMTLSWLPNTSQGRMVGDYISTSFSGGTARPVYASASAPTSGGADCASATPNCRQPMVTTAAGLAAFSQGFASNGDKALPDAASDHAGPHSAFFR